MKSFFLLALLCLCTISCTLNEPIEMTDHTVASRTSSQLLLDIYLASDTVSVQADAFEASVSNGLYTVNVIDNSDTTVIHQVLKTIVRSTNQNLRLNSNGVVYSDQDMAIINQSNGILQVSVSPNNQNLTTSFIVGDESSGF